MLLSHLTLFLVVRNAFSANILFIAPLPSPSHYLWNKALSLALVNKNHNVTILTHDTEKKIISNNYNVITMEGAYETVAEHFDFQEVTRQSTLGGAKAVYDCMEFVCKHDLETNGLQTVMNYPKSFKFDLIIYDITYGLCLYPLIERFNNPPVVAVTAFKLPFYIAHEFGYHLYSSSSYTPHYNSPFSKRMTLIERVLNFIYLYTEIGYRRYISGAYEFNLAKKVFGADIKSFREIEKNITLLLANTDPVLDTPFALPPNIIPIGGMHLKPPQKLPEDLQKIMEESKHGIILFSLGTNLQFHMLDHQQKTALFEAFGKFPQTILWKADAKSDEKFPKNVIVRKWLPQNDILGHPSTVLFITHGGLLSVQEAMYHGVPLVIMPFIIDQHTNARELSFRKLATSVDVTNLTAESITIAVNEILTHSSYRKNMKKIAERFRDQPQTPMERAVFWIEYILRHGNAEHLVLPSRDMPFYQTSNLDVLAILGLGLYFIYNFVIFLFTSLKFLIRFRRN